MSDMKKADEACFTASTARTDGWVSLNDRLPEPSDDVYYEMLHGTDDRSFAYYDPAGAKKEGNNPDWCWFDREENAWCHKYRYTHWKLITAAPSSVPQAPKKEKQMNEVKIGPWLVTYDEEAGAGYLYLFPEKRGTGCAEETVEAHTGINIDFTEDGTPLGIEVFGIFKRTPECQCEGTSIANQSNCPIHKRGASQTEPPNGKE